MKSDLVIGFGFPKANADVALSRFEEGKGLDINELAALNHLYDKDPFTKAQGKHGININGSMMEVLERLNFRITKETE